MSKLDAAAFEMFAESLERIQASLQKKYQEAETGSPEDSVLGAIDDALTAEIDNLRNLADDTDED